MGRRIMEGRRKNRFWGVGGCGRKGRTMGKFKHKKRQQKKTRKRIPARKLIPSSHRGGNKKKRDNEHGRGKSNQRGGLSQEGRVHQGEKETKLEWGEIKKQNHRDVGGKFGKVETKGNGNWSHLSAKSTKLNRGRESTKRSLDPVRKR